MKPDGVFRFAWGMALAVAVAMETVSLRAEPPADYPFEREFHGETASPLNWWHSQVTESLLEDPRWVSFDLDTVLLDTLAASPRIQIVSHQTSIALEKIVQQDAAFDANLLFDSRIGRTNDPVGNSLITGGPPRLIEESLVARGGIQRTGRRGTTVDLSQELGLLDSNSNFFEPANQGNARLGISLTQPLLSRAGQPYNERLLTQARIDSSVSWQEMRGDVEQNIADVIIAYWTLYEFRCHYLQQTDLLRRGERVQAIIQARNDFDAGLAELAKVRQRVARRIDRQLVLQAEIRKQQARLAALVGSQTLLGTEGTVEMIPLESPEFPDIELDLHDALVQGIENRPEVRAATAELESAALGIRVTRAELKPQLTAVVDAYLAGLNGNNRAQRSFLDQFTTGGPGMAAGLTYDMPYRRRAAKSRHREAHHQYQQRSEELREIIQLTRADIESALIGVETTRAQRETKRNILTTAIEEERVLTRRWELMAGDGDSIGVVLENLLDAQQRRTDAEREWISAQSNYLVSLVHLQRAMGTLLIRKGVQPMRHPGSNDIDFVQTWSSESAPTTAPSITRRPSEQPTNTESSETEETTR